MKKVELEVKLRPEVEELISRLNEAKKSKKSIKYILNVYTSKSIITVIQTEFDGIKHIRELNMLYLTFNDYNVTIIRKSYFKIKFTGFQEYDDEIYIHYDWKL